jgi:uncharacterized DUF497 family protein
MRCEWDDAKDRRNLAKHGINFEVAKSVFQDPFALSIQDRIVEDERRWQTLGAIGGVVVVMVAHTYEEREGEEVVRIISARKATPLERKAYEQGAKSQS